MEITLKAARVNAGYTLNSAASALGISYATLWRIEQGEAELTLTRFYQICKAYSVSPKDVKIHLSQKVIADKT